MHVQAQALIRCAAIALLALGLSGCGRRGNLEPAPGAPKPEASEAAVSPTAMGLDGSKAPKSKAFKAPTDPFILDPLL